MSSLNHMRLIIWLHTGPEGIVDSSASQQQPLHSSSLLSICQVCIRGSILILPGNLLNAKVCKRCQLRDLPWQAAKMLMLERQSSEVCQTAQSGGKA